MSDTPEPKRPTDHLPPADEREPDDERTTSGDPYPGGGPVERSDVSPETAAEPGEPARHGVDKLPPGPH
ncbi:hypothetical protein [Pseudactinotalea suaedae]|uniref:hypothetical protein n=1 Tax=Pseudactinotalea suaedae TaxID=1524924 RepID=UPI0012E21F5A|nr:hypothetical protein [Pseudactinotalea suaedae]